MSAFGRAVESKAIGAPGFEPRLMLITLEDLLNDSMDGGIADLLVRAKCAGKAFLSALKRSDPAHTVATQVKGTGSVR